jgi:cytochrome c-type biogenesis protein CcmH
MGMANGNQLTGRPAEVLATALELDPRQTKALWLTGFVHYQNQDYEGALRYWQQLSGILPADSKDAATVAQYIQLVQGKLGQSPETATTTPTATASSSGATKQVSVQVQLDPALQGQTRPDETVFIFARATQGPRMPLAIVRKQVSDLPLTVTLDDSMAMTPAMVLSNFDAVTVGARVSRAGTAMAQSGDLQGTVSPVTPGAEEVIQLTISEVIP